MEIAVGFVMAIVSVGVCLFCVRMGFKMGRMTQDKPVQEPKVFDPGKNPALDEYDAYDEAMSRTGVIKTLSEKEDR